MARIGALVFAYLFLALAFIGVLLPGLPTVPFLLLTAWFAARGSPRLHQWLYAHPRLGQLLIDWEQQKAISAKTKILALTLLAASWIMMYFRLDNYWLLAAITIIFCAVSAYLISRPEPVKKEG